MTDNVPTPRLFQGIITIVYIVGVNPMAQGSSSMMYNPMLMMCQNLYQTSYSQMGGVGGFPIYNQYLYHYCFVDPQEVCGFCLKTFFRYQGCDLFLGNIIKLSEMWKI